jgi:hypothetical protein
MTSDSFFHREMWLFLIRGIPENIIAKVLWDGKFLIDIISG